MRKPISPALWRALVAHGFTWLTLGDVERLGPKLLQLCLNPSRGDA